MHFMQNSVHIHVITTKDTLSYHCHKLLSMLLFTKGVLPLAFLLWHLQLTTFCLSTLASRLVS